MVQIMSFVRQHSTDGACSERAVHNHVHRIGAFTTFVHNFNITYITRLVSPGLPVSTLYYIMHQIVYNVKRTASVSLSAEFHRARPCLDALESISPLSFSSSAAVVIIRHL